MSASEQVPPAAEVVGRLPAPYFSDLVARIRAAAERRAGDVVDLARGNPEVPPPAHALATLTAAVRQPHAHGYPPFAGTARLRSAYAEHHASRFGVELDPEREVLVVPGTKTGIALVCMALAGPEDEILLPDPGYPDYPPAVALAGAQIRWLPIGQRGDQAPDWSVARERAGVVAAFLNYPSNPCGTVAPAGVFEQAVEAATRHRFALVHDLAYGELAWGGSSTGGRHASLLATPGAREVGLELVSASKTWCMAGWRIGFVLGNAELVQRVRSLLDAISVGVPLILQQGLVAALEGPQDHVDALRETYRRRSRMVASALDVRPSQGGYYTWIELPQGLDCDVLLDECGVALAPGEGFGPSGRGWARLSVATPDEQLALGLERLRSAFTAAG